MGNRVAVIGGGAAGMTAAIHAARLGAQVTIYEGNDRVGKKILSTGNGKCNFSNEKMGADYYYGSGAALVTALYEQTGVEQTKAFFQGLGMRIMSRNGYLYPASEQAATVLDVLRFELKRQGVRVHTGQRVTDLYRQPEGLCVTTADQTKRHYAAVILASGGRAAPATGSDGAGYVLAQQLGHRIVPTVPALTALRCREDFYRQVAGVRCTAALTLQIDGVTVRTTRGELQWTDYGISGIPVFQFSREAAYALQAHREVTVRIDLLPEGAAAVCSGGYDGAVVAVGDRDWAFWEERWRRQGRQPMEQFVTGLVNKKIGLLLLKLAAIRETDTAADVPMVKRERLIGLFRNLTVTVKGTNSYEQAQVCAGGVDCEEVTLELASKLVPGLFFAGEILDIDGICGGYNLQWAWSSGMTAGRAAAEWVS